MSKLISALILLMVVQNIAAQKNRPEKFPEPTSAAARMAAHWQRAHLDSISLLNNISFKNVGPTIMSGRVVDIDVNPADPTIFYVAYASGGLWKTENNGHSFFPLFDNEMVMTIGDIAVDWKHGEIIYVATGESNSSRSSYSGTGVYSSRDKGKTWQHLGLPESQHIGRIVVHPSKPDVLWVAVLGHLYSANNERGLYMTTDGGKTWKQTLFINNETGIIDLCIDPTNAQVLYAAAWQRARKAWNFSEAGTGSGIYKSMDGGLTWSLLSAAASGFPHNDGVGRIGLAISKQNSKLLYALLDNQNRKPKLANKDTLPMLSKDDLSKMTDAQFQALDDKLITRYLDKYEFPNKYSATGIKKLIEQKKITPAALVDYLEDANNNLFDTEVIGGEVYRSTDGGSTWQKQNTKDLEQFYFTYGYYFGQISVDPSNDSNLYISGYNVLNSTDGGKNFSRIAADNVHADFHVCYNNPIRSGHLILGNDGGINISYDGGKTFTHCNSPAVGQFYSVNFDYAEPFNIYGGLQDNGVWQWKQSGGNYAIRDNNGIPIKFLMGGDGMQVQIDKRDNNTVYTGYQFGNYYRIDMNKEEEKYITPQIELGEKPLRWNWQSPILISPHNQDILYMGANKLYRSMNKGDDWQCISGDLTNGIRAGDVPYGTLTSIDESVLHFGWLVAGSDDGLVHLSKDGGVSWQKITNGLPEKMWVSRVQASKHKLERIYLALSGYRWDKFDAMMYKSDDGGQTWNQLGKDLPLEPVNVIREDPSNENVVYVGTDHGLYVTLDGGKSFMRWSKALPAVPVHDIAIHPRDKKILAGTHGRSVYMADISLIQQLHDTLLKKELFLFDAKAPRHSDYWGKRFSMYDEPNVPTFQIPYYSLATYIATVTLVTDDEKITLLTLTDTAEAGINFFNFNLQTDTLQKSAYSTWLNKDKKEGDEKVVIKSADDGNIYLLPGKYKLKFASSSGRVYSKDFEVKAKEKKERGQ